MDFGQQNVFLQSANKQIKKGSISPSGSQTPTREILGHGNLNFNQLQNQQIPQSQTKPSPRNSQSGQQKDQKQSALKRFFSKKYVSTNKKKTRHSDIKLHHESKNIEEIQIKGQIEGSYNFILIPPDVEFAENHEKSSKIAKPLTLDELKKQISKQENSFNIKNIKQENYQKLEEKNQHSSIKEEKKGEIKLTECECCSYQIEREQLSMCCDSKDLEFLGSGYPLLFNFILGCLLIMSLYFLTSGAFSLYTNYIGEFCNQPPSSEEGCQDSYFNDMSLVNKFQSPNFEQIGFIQSMLNSGSAVMLMILMIFFRKKQREIDAQIDAQSTPADYSIMVRNIPKGLDIDYEQELKHLFGQHAFDQQDLNVSAVTIVYDMKFINQLKESLERAIERKQEYLQEHGKKALLFVLRPYTLEYTDFNFEIRSILERIIKTIQVIKEDPKYFMGYAFVSFGTEHERDKVLENNTHTTEEKMLYIQNNNHLVKENPNANDLMFNAQKLMIKKALEPKDINWDGFAEKGLTRRHGRIKSFFYSFLLSSFSFVILLILTLILEGYIDKVYESDDVSQLQVTFIKIIQLSIPFAIFFLNLFAMHIVPKIIYIEHQVSNSNRIISHSSKLAVMSFINSAIIDFVICTVFSHNYYKKGGFIEIQTILAILNIFFAPIVNLINREYHNKLKEKKEIKELAESKQCFLTQEQMNEAFENPEFETADVYADIINTMWISFLYSPLIPIILFCSMLNLIICYWVHKFTLLRRATVKETLSMEVSINMIENIEYIILLHALGNLIFQYQLFGTINWYSLLNLFFGCLYTILPMQEINERIWKFDHQEASYTWSQAVEQKIFEQTYEEVNPINEIYKNAQDALKTLEEEDRNILIHEKNVFATGEK